MIQGPPYVDIGEPAYEPAPPAAAGRGWTQLGAYHTRRKAEEVVRAWRAGETDPPPLRVREVRLRSTTWFRVVAGPLRLEDARRLCLRAPAYGGACWTRGEGA